MRCALAWLLTALFEGGRGACEAGYDGDDGDVSTLLLIGSLLDD